MVAATVTEYVETGLPSLEVVSLTASDGETYKSRKFATVTGVVCSGNEDNDAHINASKSGATVTVNYAGMTDKLVTLFIVGKH